jgi:regulation of enolase protein 1 (concanavalin A-like superfamily)
MQSQPAFAEEPSSGNSISPTAFVHPGLLHTDGDVERTLAARTFIHPGIPLTREDLDEVKRNIASEPWKSAFEALRSDRDSQLGRRMAGPFDTVCRTPDTNLRAWKGDMDAVYKLSLLWYLTGNEAYAKKGHDVLMAYVKGQKSFGGAEMYLSLGDYAGPILGGADILRGTWPGWTPQDTALCKSYFRKLYARDWSTNPLRSANQGSLQLINYVCVSVFLDDSEMFNDCVRMFLSDPETALTDTLPNGELGDSGRDQGHAAGELSKTVLAAEIFWKQGVDVYSARENRLLAMGEFYARYNLKYPTPFMPFGTKYALYPTHGGLPGNGSTWISNIIYKAYTTRMGLSAPYSAQAMDVARSDVDSFLYHKIADHSRALPPPPMPAPAPTEPVTAGLVNAEIGDASPRGSGAFAGGTWTIRGGGKAAMLKPPWDKWAWRVDDSCHFAYRKVTGDATLIARVTSIEEVQNFTMAGLMIRDSLEPKAARMLVWSTPNARNGPSVETDLRGFSASSHGSSCEIHENAAIPYWLKLERLGDRITCWHSPDGASWTPIEDGLFPGMGKTACLGLFVCSTVNGKTATATFDNVRMTGGGGVEQVKRPAAPFAIYGGPGDGQVPLRWLESFGATSYNIKRATVKGGPYQTVAAVKGTSLVDRAVKNGETYYYVVSAMNSAGESPNSLEDSVTLRSP